MRKKVLIKSIAMTMPLYAMFVFLLPKCFYNELTLAIHKFWWSNSLGRWRIYGVHKEVLIQSKWHGRLSLWNISLFNFAILAKQA